MQKLQGAKKISRIILTVDFILCTIICIACLFQMTSVVSACFYATFFMLICLMSDYAVRNTQRFNAQLLALVLLSLITVLLNYLQAGGQGESFNYYKKVIMFISTVLFFFYIEKCQVSEPKIISNIFAAVIVVSCVYIFRFYTNRAQCYYFGGRISSYLTFGMTNPNLTGIYLVCFGAYAATFFFLYKSRFIKLVCAFVFAYMFYFLLETRARNALIAMVFFIVLLIYSLFKKTRISPAITLVISWYPMLFVVFYLLVIKNATLQDKLDFLVSDGKTLDTRYDNWLSALRMFVSSPIVGAYSQISDGTGVSQMLNTHLDVLASYGIIVFILFMSFLKRVTYEISMQAELLPNKIALLGFFSCIFAGAGEAALVSGGTGIYVLVGGFLLLAKYNPNEKKGYKGLI